MIHIARVVSVAVLVAIAAPSAFADKNEIRAVAIEEHAGVTQIRGRGIATPTFTVYRLDRPTRVVVDVAQATLAEAVRGDHESSATFAANTWAVSQVAAIEL